MRSEDRIRRSLNLRDGIGSIRLFRARRGGPSGSPGWYYRAPKSETWQFLGRTADEAVCRGVKYCEACRSGELKVDSGAADFLIAGSFQQLDQEGKSKTLIVARPLSTEEAANFFRRRNQLPTTEKVPTFPSSSVGSTEAQARAVSRTTQWREGKQRLEAAENAKAVHSSGLRVLFSISKREFDALPKQSREAIGSLGGLPILWLPFRGERQTVVKKSLVESLEALLRFRKVKHRIADDSDQTGPVWSAFSAGPPPQERYVLDPSTEELDTIPPSEAARYVHGSEIAEWEQRQSVDGPSAETIPIGSYPWPMGTWRVDGRGPRGCEISQLREVAVSSVVPPEATVNNETVERVGLELKEGRELCPVDAVINDEGRVALQGFKAATLYAAAKAKNWQIPVWVSDSVIVPLSFENPQATVSALTLEMINPSARLAGLEIDLRLVRLSVLTRFFWQAEEELRGLQTETLKPGEIVTVPYKGARRQATLVRLPKDGASAIVSVRRGGNAGATHAKVPLVEVRPLADRPQKQTEPKDKISVVEPVDSGLPSAEIWTGKRLKDSLVLQRTSADQARLSLGADPEFLLWSLETGEARSIFGRFDGTNLTLPLEKLGVSNLLQVKEIGGVWGELRVDAKDARLVLGDQKEILLLAAAAEAEEVGHGAEGLEAIERAYEKASAVSLESLPTPFDLYFKALRRSLLSVAVARLGPVRGLELATRQAEAEGFTTFDRLLRTGSRSPERLDYLRALLGRFRSERGVVDPGQAWAVGAEHALTRFLAEPKRVHKDEASRLLDGQERPTKASASAEDRARRFGEAARRKRAAAKPLVERPAVENPTPRRIEQAQAMRARGENYLLQASIFDELARLLRLGCDPPYVGSVDPCLPNALSALDSASVVEYVINHAAYRSPVLNKDALDQLAKNVRSGSEEHRKIVAAAIDRCDGERCVVQLNARELDDLMMVVRAALVRAPRDLVLRGLRERIADINRLFRAGITSADSYDHARNQLLALARPGSTRTKEEKEKEEILLYARTEAPSFYVPTPSWLAQKMVREAMPTPGERILEPGGGTAAIADAIREAGFEPQVAEINERFRRLLQLKKYELVGTDFLALRGFWDVIIGNPPFGAQAEQRHLKHAYGLLRPGGRVVFVFPNGSLDAQRFPEFAAWLRSVNARVEPLPDGVFRNTKPAAPGVEVSLVVILKPGSSGATQENRPELSAPLVEPIQLVSINVGTSIEQLIRGEQPLLLSVSSLNGSVRLFTFVPQPGDVWLLSERSEDGSWNDLERISGSGVSSFDLGILLRRELARRTVTEKAPVLATAELWTEESEKRPLDLRGPSPPAPSLQKLAEQRAEQFPELAQGRQVRVKPNRAVIYGESYAGRTGALVRQNRFGGWLVRLDKTEREKTAKEVLVQDEQLELLEPKTDQAEPDTAKGAPHQQSQQVEEETERKELLRLRSREVEEQTERHEGSKYRADLEPVEISRLLRGEISAYLKSKPHLAGTKVSVTTDESTIHASINLLIQKFPSKIYTDEAVRTYLSEGRRIPQPLTPEAAEFEKSLTGMAAAYQKYTRHGQSDLDNSNFSFDVRWANGLLREQADRSKQILEQADVEPIPTPNNKWGAFERGSQGWVQLGSYRSALQAAERLPFLAPNQSPQNRKAALVCPLHQTQPLLDCQETHPEAWQQFRHFYAKQNLDAEKLEKATCALCRQSPGSSPDCERCENFRVSVQERDNPTPDQRIAKEKLREQIKRERQDERDSAERWRARLAGRRIRVALVGCGKEKLPTKTKAKDLYIGTLFKAARAYAETCFDDWVILSAKYNVLDPEIAVDPYDLQLASFSEDRKAHWRRTTRDELADRYRGLDVAFVGLAGEEYLSALTGVERPLEGLGIGERIRKLRELTKECVPVPRLPVEDPTDAPVPAEPTEEQENPLLEEVRQVEQAERWLDVSSLLLSLESAQRKVSEEEEWIERNMKARMSRPPDNQRQGEAWELFGWQHEEAKREAQRVIEAVNERLLLLGWQQLQSSMLQAGDKALVFGDQTWHKISKVNRKTVEVGGRLVPISTLQGVDPDRRKPPFAMPTDSAVARAKEYRGLIAPYSSLGIDEIRELWNTAEVNWPTFALWLSRKDSLRAISAEILALGTEESRRGIYLSQLRDGLKRSGLSGFWQVLDSLPTVLWQKPRAVLAEMRHRLKSSDAWQKFLRGVTEEDLLGIVEELGRKLPPPGMGLQAIEAMIQKLWPERFLEATKPEEPKVPRKLSYDPTPNMAGIFAQSGEPARNEQEEAADEEVDDTSNEALERAFTDSRAMPLNKSATRVFKLLTVGLSVGESRKVQRSSGFMAVSVDRLSNQTFALAHNYTQNGDLMADPDMEFFVSRSGLVFPVALQQDGLPGGSRYFRVVEDGRVKLSENGKQATFANQWLKNIEQQQDLRDRPDVTKDEPLSEPEAAATPETPIVPSTAQFQDNGSALDPRFARRLALITMLRGESR